jgi:NAD(P)-dependent dehydrogenase (short-subunit alcohol dehydrogenase family)
LKQRASDQLTPIFLDVTEHESISSAAETVASAVGEAGVVGLVNNAGFSVNGPLEFLPICELRKQFETNVIGQIAVTQAFMPLIRKGNGRVINVGSMRGELVIPMDGPYCASKFALEALTASLRMELRPWSIPVLMVQPGFIATGVIEKSLAAWDKLAEDLPQHVHTMYGPYIDSARRFANRMSVYGSPTEDVARTIAKALMAKKPKRRYRVGRGAKIQPFVAKYVPAPISDWVIVKMLGLRKAQNGQLCLTTSGTEGPI